MTMMIVCSHTQSYCNVFKTVGEVLGPFDTAMVPIGAYKPRWFLRAIHCNPAEAVKIHQDLRAKQSIAMHWVRCFWGTASAVATAYRR